MSKDLIDESDGFGPCVTAYSGGKEAGLCIQLSVRYGKTYSRMTKDKAIEFFELAIKRIKEHEIQCTRIADMAQAQADLHKWSSRP